MAHYQWDPELYRHNSSVQNNLAQELVTQLQQRLRGDEAILDVGCGDGRISAAIHDFVPRGRVLGIDVSEPMLTYARRQYGSLANSGLEFQSGSADSLSWRDEFDYIVSFSALHWVQNHERVLDGMYRCLKPGGRIMLQFGASGNVAELINASHTLINKPHWKPYFEQFQPAWYFFEREEYSSLVKRSGFSESSVRINRQRSELVNIDRFKKWLFAVWRPFLHRLPEQMHRDFIRELVPEYLRRRPLGADGSVEVEMVRLEIEARRP